MKVQQKLIEDRDEEILWMEVLLQRKILLGLVYRATYTDLLTENEGTDKLSKMLETAHLTSNNVILLGDLNCDTSHAHPDNTTSRLIDACSAYGMDQLINKPTRVTEESISTIDHIWTDQNNELIKESGTFVGISDHLGTYAKLNIRQSKVPPTETKHRRDWRNYNEDEFRKTLERCIEESNISVRINQKDVNECLKALTSAIQQAMDEHAPMKALKVRTTKPKTIPWYDQEIEEIKQEKNKYLQLFYMLRDQRDKDQARSLSKKLTHLKEKRKKLYYSKKNYQNARVTPRKNGTFSEN